MSVNEKQRFTDVPPGHQFYELIQMAATLGITGGYPDGTFRPDAPITRAEALAFDMRVYRAAWRSLQNQIQSVIAKAKPSVVRIKSHGPNGYHIGTGSVIRADGLILTNRHVLTLEGTAAGTLASKVYVEVIVNFDGWEEYWDYEADIIAADAYMDAALLKLRTTKKDFPIIPLHAGVEGEEIEGFPVVCMGYPLGLQCTATFGILSQDQQMVGGYITHAQTDAAINPGNSGGPMLTLDGKLLGVNTLKITGQDNLGFAVPVRMVKEWLGTVKIAL